MIIFDNHAPFYSEKSIMIIKLKMQGATDSSGECQKHMLFILNNKNDMSLLLIKNILIKYKKPLEPDVLLNSDYSTKQKYNF